MDTRSELLCGSIAGLAGAAADYPLDTLKTRMQLFSGTKYRSYSHCAGSMFRSEGPLSFYKGVSIPLMAQGLENAILFSVFQSSLRTCALFFDHHQLECRVRSHDACAGTSEEVCSTVPPLTNTSVPSTLPLLLASATAGLAVSVVLTPVEYLKCNMQAENSLPATHRAHDGLLSFVRWSYHTHGLAGFYRGFAGTVARAVPGNMAYFYTYTALTKQLSEICSAQPHSHSGRDAATERQEKLWWHAALAGGASGCAYWTVMFPADVVKTRMQVDPTCAALGLRRTLLLQVKQLGIRSLYNGWCVTALRSFVSSGVVFTVYEQSAAAAHQRDCQLDFS